MKKQRLQTWTMSWGVRFVSRKKRSRKGAPMFTEASVLPARKAKKALTGRIQDSGSYGALLRRWSTERKTARAARIIHISAWVGRF